MPSYLFKCPECKQLIARVRSRKYEYIRDECHGGKRGARQVRMKYVRTVKR